MKKIAQMVLVVGFASAIAVATALGQPVPGATWTFDELGSGLFNSPSVAGYSTGFRSVEPFSGINILTYNLGYPGTIGDVFLIESVAGGTNYSDLIRFDGQGHLYFFSDLEPGEVPSNWSDVLQLPPPLPGYAPNLIENGPEGNNFATWKPLPGEAGSDPIVPGITYVFISDVPEPTTVTLAAAGTAALLALRRRR